MSEKQLSWERSTNASLKSSLGELFSTHPLQSHKNMWLLGLLKALWEWLGSHQFPELTEPNISGGSGIPAGAMEDRLGLCRLLKMSSLRMSVNVLPPDVKSHVCKRKELHSRKDSPLPQICLQACSLAKQIWLVRNPQAFLLAQNSIYF